MNKNTLLENLKASLRTIEALADDGLGEWTVVQRDHVPGDLRQFYDIAAEVERCQGMLAELQPESPVLSKGTQEILTALTRQMGIISSTLGLKNHMPEMNERVMLMLAVLMLDTITSLPPTIPAALVINAASLRLKSELDGEK